MPYEAPSAGKANQPDDMGEEVAPEGTPEEDLEAESKAQRGGDKDQGAVEKVEEKGKELLDKVAGPDVPPSLTDEEKRT